MKNILFAALFLLGLSAHAQGIFNMVNDGGAPVRYVACSGSFNDDGGNSNYSNNFNGTATFCPGIQTDRMQLNIFSLALLAGDVLTVYDGDSTAAPVIGTYTDTTAAPGMLQASPGNPTGCLTVRFTSNGSGNAQGWRAAISCFDPCQSISTSITTTPPIDPDGILRICQGETVTFNGSATFGTDGTGATYEWNLGNGNGLNPGAIQTETYNTSGIYIVDFVVTDNTGCRDRESRDLFIHVSTDPDFTGTAAAQTDICFGESTTITAVVTPVEFEVTPSPPITGQTFLPDGSGVSYRTCINVDLFAPGQTLNNAADLVDIFLNMEHSYLGDLDVSVTAPNGATVSLHNYPSGGGTFLGIPIDPGTGPGTGFDYVFTEQGGATQTWAQIQATVSTIPAGNYLPVDPFSTFIGTPLNGQWCINITDNLGSDDGYIFFWGLNFNPAIIPSDLSFTPGATSEQWLSDPTITATSGNVITVTPTTAGNNCYTYEFVDNFGCTYTEVVCVNVYPEILNGTPSNITACSATGSTATVDLTSRDGELLNGLPPADYTITYHETQTDAENLVNAISTPTSYTTTSNPQTIYVALQNNATLCVVVESFDVIVVNAVFNAVTDMVVCDDPTNDGFEVFDLTIQDATILGGQSAADFTVTYHNSQADADANVNAIATPSSYTNVVINQETIYARVESNADATCFATGTFDLIVSTTPTANAAADIIVCDDASNDGVEVFDFTGQVTAVLGAQNPADFTVTFHSSQADADANANPIGTSYTNAGTGLETIYVRIETNTNTDCYNTTTFDIRVDSLGIVNPINDLVVCDDASNDGFEVFDLTTVTPVALGGQVPADFNVTYHNSQADADANTNAITGLAAYTNTVAGQETIYVRVESAVNGTCYSTGTFDLIVSTTPTAHAAADIIVCDDASNDGVEVFDFTGQVTAVLGAQNPADFTVTFHNSQADADANANPIGTSYTNAGTGLETIYVRIETNSNTDCYNTTTYDIRVDSLGIVNPINDLVVCDDASNDGFEVFDLTTVTPVALGGQVPADFNVTYHNSQADADANTNAITGLAAYTNTVAGQETIYVRVESAVNGTCYSTGTFDLIVSTTPTAHAAADIIVCDDASNDGVEVFDFTGQVTAVLGAQNPADFTVTFHSSQADADANANPLGTSYTNVVPTETIYIRITNDLNTDCYDVTTFVITVNPLPAIITPANIELCDDPSGDGVEVFDLTSNDAALLNGVNPADVSVTYHLNQVDAESGLNAITSAYTNTTSPESIFVRVVDNTTACFNIVSYDLVILGVPVINTAVSNYEECDDDADGVAVFDLTNRFNEIINGQSGVSVILYETAADAASGTSPISTTYNNTASPQIIYYRLVNDTTGCYSLGDFVIEVVGAPVAGVANDLEECEDNNGNASTDLTANTAVITGGVAGLDVTYHNTAADADAGSNALGAIYDYSSNTTIHYRVEDVSTGCSSIGAFDVIINPLPEPTLLSQYVLCIDPNGVLLNGPTDLDTGLTTTDYTFEWSLDGTLIAGATSGNHPATQPGNYEVRVTDIMTGCETTQSTFVRQSGIPDSYTVDVTTSAYDLTHQIVVIANGPDDYWYRLDDGPYVARNVFDDVTPGLHQVTIAERSGCGEIVVEVFVYGYPDFFTPNNDGFNDTWNIVGADRLTDARVYIFDRYGKLLKQIDPTGFGWDGTYNGAPLPSSDYWFRIEYTLPDGRSGVANGHFSLKR